MVKRRPTYGGRLEKNMDYKLIYTPDEIRQYIGSAGIVAFDFETAPNDEWRNEPKA